MNGRTDYSAAVRRCFETLDVSLMRKLWKHIAPHMPQPKNDEEALVTLHMARTSCDAIDAKLRMYSHAWLRERSYPSQLPDHMKASAERLYPIVVKAVGTSINSFSGVIKPVLGEVRQAVKDAVLEIHADGKIDDSDLVRRRINEAKQLALGKLLGIRR